MSQFAEETQKQFSELEPSHERMEILRASMDKIVKNIKEGLAQLSKASEETNKRLNLVFEEQQHSKRDRAHLDQDIRKLFNVYHSMKPQQQGHVIDNPYHQDDIKPDAMLINKERSPSQRQDGDNMYSSEEEGLKQLSEASNWPKLSGTGEYDHIDGIFIDVPSIPDYWITARLNTAFRGHASIWYTEMKEIHGRGNWPWWKSQIIQKYGNVTWIWEKTVSLKYDNYSLDKDTYEWCLRQSKRPKAIDPQRNIRMRNHIILTQITGELEHAVKCRCNHNCMLDDIENTLQEIRKRANIGKYTQYKITGFKEKQPFKVEFKDKPAERVAEVAKTKGKEKVYAIEKVPEEESPKEDSDSGSMGDAIREQSVEEQKQREEFLVEYQEETPLDIQDIQLEEVMPQDTANKSLCKHPQDAQTFLLTPTKGMEYINGKDKKMTAFIQNAHHPLIIDCRAHCSMLARNYLDNHFPNWEKTLLPTKAKNFKIASGKNTSIGKIIKEIIIPHRNGIIRLNQELVVLDDAHFQGLLLGSDFQRMYGIHIYNSKKIHIEIGTNNKRKVSLDIYQISAGDPLEELLNEFREGQFSTTLTSKQKLSLLKILRKNRPAFAIGEEPLGKIRGHDIELNLDVKRLYPPMLRRPPYPGILETRKVSG
ncbi:hypothetical protein O181_067591 [Austropuccinia psidii MF-1]|uniref:Uncharacterized protein n=1 Tax=Austropuccinia psidii MF-1 TaxID=1389203 RepID=A0A9Q3I372_9BASI|nr:hypothetical protein [Austropuccinia psidii MF-1]